MSAHQPTVIDLQLPSGRLRAERRGALDAPLVLCAHGLSANLRAFDVIAPSLAAGGDRQVVALDFRGRGRSETTPPGTYGLPSHAADVLDAASVLGADRFDLIGWSMGALAAIQAVAAAPGRIRRLVLIDHAGRMDQAALEAVRGALARLDSTVERPEDYVTAIRAAGAVTPWHPQWEAYFRYELRARNGGWAPQTSRTACEEDLDRADFDGIRALWPQLTMPTLLVRCTAPLGGGLVVPSAERDALGRAVPRLRLLEIPVNHYGVMTDARTVEAIGAFVGAAEPLAQTTA